MFEYDSKVALREVQLSTPELASLIGHLGRLDADVDDAERIDQIRLLEELKAAAAAGQARVTAALAASQRRQLREQGVPLARQGRPIAAEVALARRDSPTMGSRHLGLAEALLYEMPGTYAALSRGQISEWRATIMVRETACLSREHRTAVDAELAPRLGSLGDRQTGNEARRIAYRLDPHSVMNRVRGAEGDRRVTIRPAPDTMTLVTGYLPAKQGVAVFAALSRHADRMRSSGDERSRGQIMADEYVDRLTRCSATPVEGTDEVTTARIDLDVQLVMTEATLLRGDDAPATLVGHGPIPAPLARRMLREADGLTRVWIRRLYTDPASGRLVTMESRRRRFDHSLRQFLVFRDEVCRTPWCSAPIRHGDHVSPVDEGGPTSVANGQGLCEACNYVKQSPGWSARARPGGPIETTTPTGHTYVSLVPPLVTPSRASSPPRARASVPRVRQLVSESASEHRLRAVMTTPSSSQGSITRSGAPVCQATTSSTASP
jgi:hypothetical protein